MTGVIASVGAAFGQFLIGMYFLIGALFGMADLVKHWHRGDDLVVSAIHGCFYGICWPYFAFAMMTRRRVS